METSQARAEHSETGIRAAELSSTEKCPTRSADTWQVGLQTSSARGSRAQPRFREEPAEYRELGFEHSCLGDTLLSEQLMDTWAPGRIQHAAQCGIQLHEAANAAHTPRRWGGHERNSIGERGDEPREKRKKLGGEKSLIPIAYIKD